MPNVNVPFGKGKPQTVGASESEAVVSKDFRITGRGSINMRLDFYVGKVVAATGVSVGMQQSAGYDIWNSTKTTSVTASTDKAVTGIDTGTDTLTSAGHGLSDGTAVAVSATSLPGGIYDTKVYYIRDSATNTFKLAESVGGAAVDISSAGTDVVVAALRQFSLTFQTTVAGDQTYLPLQGKARAVASTGAGDSLQLMEVLVSTEN